MIPLLNANNYTITLKKISLFGGGSNDSNYTDLSWDIIKSKNGFYIRKNNPDAAYYFGTLYPNKFFDVNYTVS